jgi:hypothetical protein
VCEETANLFATGTFSSLCDGEARTLILPSLIKESQNSDPPLLAREKPNPNTPLLVKEGPGEVLH